jgi:hypothetical protein
MLEGNDSRLLKANQENMINQMVLSDSDEESSYFGENTSEALLF